MIEVYCKDIPLRVAIANFVNDSFQLERLQVIIIF